MNLRDHLSREPRSEHATQRSDAKQIDLSTSDKCSEPSPFQADPERPLQGPKRTAMHRPVRAAVESSLSG